MAFSVCAHLSLNERHHAGVHICPVVLDINDVTNTEPVSQNWNTSVSTGKPLLCLSFVFQMRTDGKSISRGIITRPLSLPLCGY